MVNQVQAASAEEQAIVQRITRLKNEQLLQLMETANTLYQNTHYPTLSLDQEQKVTLDAVNKEAQKIKELLNQEYSVRVLRGYQLELKKLLAALQPTPPTETGGRLIPLPIRVGATPENSAPFQQDPLQSVLNAFAEEIRAIYAPNPENAQPGEEQEAEERP